MFYDIRNRILRRVFEQCTKLLGPDPIKGTDNINENYLKQWNRTYVSPIDGTPVPWQVTDLDNLPPNYPLNKEDILVLGSDASDGLDARRIQYVQMGSVPWTSVRDQGLIPCIFIENATEGISITDPTQFNTHIGEVLPINIRFITVQAPDSSLSYSTSNPVLVAKMRGALDYILDPSEFKGLSEKGKKRRGYRTPSQVFSADIVAAENFEGQISPFEVVDYRLEVVFSRARQRGGQPTNELQGEN